MNDNAAFFVATLLHSGTNAHFQHWATKSFAEHMALGDYYERIVDLVDQFAEAYMGRYEQLEVFPEDFHLEVDPVSYMEKIKKFVEESRKHLPDDTELQNLVDEIADLINTTLYKLRFLR